MALLHVLKGPITFTRKWKCKRCMPDLPASAKASLHADQSTTTLSPLKKTKQNKNHHHFNDDNTFFFFHHQQHKLTAPQQQQQHYFLISISHLMLIHNAAYQWRAN